MIWLLACDGRDPALAPEARALAAWEEGRGKLEAGDAAGARDLFRRARAEDDHPLLAAWEASAAAGAGDPEGAVELLGPVLQRAPGLASARYARAAWLVRLGREDEAAADLRRALDDGAAKPVAVLEDPDFAAVLDHPAFAFLPRQPFTVALEAPPPTAFWGAELTVALRVEGAIRPPVTVTAEVAEGPIELLKAVEDSDDDALRFAWTWRVAGAGRAVLGPFTVRSGRYEARADAVTVEATTPPGREQAEVPPVAVRGFGDVAEGVPERSAAVVRGALVARGGPADRVETVPPLPPPAIYERRRGGQLVEVAWVWPPGPVAKTVRIRGPSGVVFDGPPGG